MPRFQQVTGSIRLLPAAPGTCDKCARKHEARHAHDATSLFYQMRFQMVHGRSGTWADACAHLPEDHRKVWREQLHACGEKWTEPAAGVEPIAETVVVAG